MLERFLHGALGNFIEHHAERGLGRLLRNYFFGEMLADSFAFTIRVGGQIDCVDFLRSLL